MTMAEAARFGDEIEHSFAAAGFLVGALMGVALIAATAFVLATFILPPGGCLVAGLVVGAVLPLVAEKAAWGLVELGKSIGSAFSSGCGTLVEASGNVFINGRGAIRAVLSQGACSKHPGNPQVAQGSDTVFINGQPAARIGDKLVCGAVIASGSGNVLIGGGTAECLPMQDEVPPHWEEWTAKAFMAAEIIGGLGVVIRKGLSSRLPCVIKFAAGFLMGEFIGRYVVPKTIEKVGGLLGFPVDVISGQKVLFGEEDNDFTLPAHLPLTGQRYYHSAVTLSGMLGTGWRSEWECFLTVSDNGVIYYDAMGRDVPFPRPGILEKFFNYEEQTFLTGMPGGGYCISSSDDLFLLFSAPDAQGIARLIQLEDQQGKWTRLHYNDDNQLTQIEDSSDNWLHFSYLVAPFGCRLADISLQLGREDKALQSLVNYQYDDAGQLARVYNGEGQLTRAFSYHNGRMNSQRLRSGMQITYHWGQVAGEWRITESITALGERHSYRYDTDNLTSTVKDSYGNTALWHYNDKQQVLYFEDFDKREYRTQYNEQGELTALILPGEQRLECEMDDLGRVMSTTDAAGHTSRFYYQGNSFINIIRYQYADGTGWNATYNARGLLTEYTDPNGAQTRYHYNSQHELERVTDAQGGEVHLSWNRRGQLSRRLDCSGNATDYDYSPLGQLARITNSQGQSSTWQYDRAGQLLSATGPEGTSEQLVWNSRGLPVQWQDGQGQSVHRAYDKHGLLQRMTDRTGHHLHYHYNQQGYLTTLDNGNGGRYRFRYDAVGRLLAELRPDSTSLHYRYNVAGQVEQLIERGSQQLEGTHPRRTTEFTYNKAGLLSEKRTQSAVTCYQYDKVNALLKADVTPTVAGETLGLTPQVTEFTYDKAGQIVSEQSNGDTLGYSYDALGNLQRLSLPHGGDMEWLSYGSGHISAIKLNQRLVSEFSRDTLYQEISRTQGALTQYSRYDKTGRLQWRSAILPHQPVPQSAEGGLLSRSFQYNRNSELVSSHDTLRGNTRWILDAEGRMQQCWQTRFGEESYTDFKMDTADNLLDTRHPFTPLTNNRLTRYGSNQYKFDAWGNVTERRVGGNTQHYIYDAENRLVIATRPGEGGFTAHYHYDAFGRRVSKEVERPVHGRLGEVETTRINFTWQGMRLLQERHNNNSLGYTYVYSPDADYTPIAQVKQWLALEGVDDELFYYHTDLNGAPLDMTNEEGRIVWSGDYAPWGKVINQTQTFLLQHGSAPPDIWQPLRYAGQYEDEETGLHQNLHRFYAPEVGRYIQPDPIGLVGGLNLYSYGPNPANWVDPLGLAGEGIPHGFKSFGQFKQFGQALQGGLSQAGYPGSISYMQGSSVSGVSFSTRQPFDVGRISDFDVAISNKQLYQKAEALGLAKGGRTGPINMGSDAAKQLGIDNTLQKVSRMSDGRPVNAMIFEDPANIKAKGQSTRIPGKCGGG